MKYEALQREGGTEPTFEDVGNVTRNVAIRPATRDFYISQKFSYCFHCRDISVT
jgi:hypothetical protein